MKTVPLLLGLVSFWWVTLSLDDTHLTSSHTWGMRRFLRVMIASLFCGRPCSSLNLCCPVEILIRCRKGAGHAIERAENAHSFRWAAADVCPKQRCSGANPEKAVLFNWRVVLMQALLPPPSNFAGFRLLPCLSCGVIVGFGRSSRRSSFGGASRFRMASSRTMAGASYLCLALVIVALMCSSGEGQSVNLREKPTVPPKILCDACLEFSAEAQRVLSDPKFRKHAVDYMSKEVCKPLTPRLEKQCVNLVNTYLSDAFDALYTYLGPEVCTEVALCVAASRSEVGTRGRLFDQTLRGDPKACLLCQDFAKDALSYLGSNATKSKILDALHHACSRLEDVSRQCDLLVDLYAPQLMENLDDLTPEEFCEVTHLCMHRRKRALAIRGVGKDNCAVCQFVVLEVKLKLKDPVTQEMLLEVLLNGCGRVKNHVDECKIIVSEYAPFIIENLDNILDGDALCRKIGACKSRKFDSILASVLDRHAHHRVHVL